MTRGRATAALLAAATALLPALLIARPAGASLYDTYGFGTRGTTMGGAMTTLATDYDAVYYNPANLLKRKATHVGITLGLVVPQLDVQRISGQDPVQVLLPGSNGGFHLGLSSAVGGYFEDKIAFGVTLFHPLVKLTRIESIDPELPYFYRYQNLPDKLIISLGAAIEPWPWLRLGVGAQVLAELGGEVRAAVSLQEGRFTQETLDMELTAVAAPTAGIAVGPIHGLHLAATWRTHLELSYEIPITVAIEDIGDLRVAIEGVSLFTPDQLALGIGWESAPEDEAGFSTEVGLTWSRWSQAPSAGARFLLTIDDVVLRADEEDHTTQNLIEAKAEPIPLGARDTFEPRVGLEYRPTAEWAVRAGYVFRPTPLPRPIHHTNTLDSTSHVVSFGGGFKFEDPTRVSRSPLQVGLGLQMTILEKRVIVKAANGTPDGSYSFNGMIWNVMLDLRHDF